MNKFINKIMFLGLELSLPLGILLCIMYDKFIKFVRMGNGYITGGYHGSTELQSIDYLVMAILIIGSFLLVFLINLKRKYIDKEQDFSPIKHKTGMERSLDKNKAIYHKIPSEFLSDVPNGLTLGKQGRKYIRIPFKNSPEHQLIYGAPGSNKSTSLLNSLIYSQNFADGKNDGFLSALVVDCKPELSKKSIDESRKDLKIINPTSFDSYGFDAWYGLDESCSDDELMERSQTISRSLITSLSGDNAHFSGNAQKLLSGFLMYGFRKGMSFAESITNVLHLNIQDYISQIITDPGMKNHPKIIGKVKAFEGNTSDEFASIVDTLEMELNIFELDTVQNCFDSNPNKATPYDLTNGVSIYLAIPDDKMKMYSRLFGLIIELCMNYLSSIKEEELEDRLPVWMLIDEGGTIFIPSLIDVLSRGRSKKIQVSLVCQSYSQLETLYSPKDAETINECCKTTIVFSCKNDRTCKSLSALTGYYRETKYSVNTKGSFLSAQDSENMSYEYRPVMDVSDINELERNNEVLVFAKEGWFVTKKLPYYEIPKFRDISDYVYRKNIGAFKTHQRSSHTFDEFL